MRRRVWGETSLMGSPFEYTGTGIDLFRGFLIAIPTLFLPYFVVFGILPQFLATETYDLVALVFYPVFVFVLNLGFFLMRRYQLARTRWRGIRFGLDGSALGFAALSLLFSVLELVTLGWFHPIARMRRAKMLWGNARFGSQKFTFAANDKHLTRGLWGPFAMGWFLTLFLGLILLVVTSFVMAGVNTAVLMAGGDNNTRVALSVGFFFLMILVFALLFNFAFANFQAAAIERTAELTKIAGVSPFWVGEGGKLMRANLLGIVVTIGTLGLLAPVWGMWMFRTVFGGLIWDSTADLDAIAQGAAGPGTGEGVADSIDLDFGAGLL